MFFLRTTLLEGEKKSPPKRKWRPMALQETCTLSYLKGIMF
jgi:hypothetical protein